MKIFLSIFSIGFCLLVNGQNLIRNGNFQDTIQSGVGYHWPRFWTSPSNGSPDFYHFASIGSDSVPLNLTGYQFGKLSDEYIGMVVYSKDTPNAREYIQAKLTRPLVQDSSYCFSAYISLADSMNYATKIGLGAYFSNQKIISNLPTTLLVTPQIEIIDVNFFTDKINWIEISGRYKALGGEEYITIGSFRNDSQTDTLNIGGGGQQFWQDAVYYYLDDVWLSHCDSTIGLNENRLENNVSIFPNPIQENFTLKTSSKKQLSFQLFDVLGKAVNFSFTKTRDEYLLSVGDIPKGIYFLRVSDGKETTSIKLLKQ